MPTMMIDTALGRFAVQSLLHSLVALFLVEASFRIWQESDHRTKFAYRVCILLFPVVLPPFFQFLSPHRGGFYFAQDAALFQSLRWFDLRLGGMVSVGWALLLAVGLVTTAVVYMQEIVPLIRTLLSRRETYSACPVDHHLWAMVEEVAIGFGLPCPNIRILDDNHPVIYTSGTFRPVVYLSTGLMSMLHPEQLRAAIAHELAHIARKSTATTLLIFIVRMILFYNPVSLLVFRRLVQDDEHICDDMALSAVGHPEPLVSTLRQFVSDVPEEAHGPHGVKLALEEHSRNLLLMDRIRRLEGLTAPMKKTFSWGRFILVQGTVAALCYRVV